MGLKESGLRGSIRNVSTGIGAAISIDTLEAEDVGEDSATIRGEITELTNFGEDAEVFFEWGEITEGLPNTTDIQLQDTVGVFTEDLTNLSEDTTHEFQAFGSVRDVSDEGVVLTFETGAAIPDSAIHQHPLDEGSGTTINDIIGNLNGTLGDTDAWTTDSRFEGGNALDWDNVSGSGGSVSMDYPTEFDPTGEPFGFGITLDISGPIPAVDGDTNIVGATTSNNDTRFAVTRDDRGGDELLMDCVPRDENDRSPQVVDSSDLDPESPDQFRAFLLIEGTDLSDHTIYIDDTEVSTNNSDESSMGFYADQGNEELHIGSRSGGGDVVPNTITDNPIIYQDPSREDISADYAIQPWS